MKVSYRWVRDVAPGIGLSATEAMAKLAMRGAPVEEVEDLAEGLRDIVVGQVIDARPHPNADRLTLCRVLGPAGEVPVVCGAPDVRTGSYYPFAPVGALLPGGFKIGKRKIRGQLSRGMLCSERELGLGEDHAGIMLLDGEFEPGAPFAQATGLDDIRFDVEVTPNRGDLLSHVGVARELHPDGHDAIVLPAFPGADGDLAERSEGLFERGGAESASAGVRIAIEDPDLCSRYLGAVIRGVEVGPSPRWLENRLLAAGARPINNVVDATNYVMLELGQPLHAFDLSKLADATIVVGRARPGETLVTLDGERRPVAPDMLMIRDAADPVAIAGVMGGRDSEVSSGTTDILLECALFEPKQVRATRRALGMSTDASYRFERGVDPATMETAVLRAAELIMATAGGRLDGRVIDACPAPWKAPVVTLRPSRVKHLLGVDFAPDEIEALLAPLGYAVADRRGDAIDFVVPGAPQLRHAARGRSDRGGGAHPRLRRLSVHPIRLPPRRRVRPPPLPARGSAARASRRRRHQRGPDPRHRPRPPRRRRPPEPDVRRREPPFAATGCPGCSATWSATFRAACGDVRLFEIATAFAHAAANPAPGDAASPPAESARVAVVLHGRRAPLQWSDAGDPFDVHDIARVLETDRAGGAPGWPGGPGGGGHGAVRARSRPTSCWMATGRWWGRAGEVRAEAVDLPPWAGTVVGAEVVLPALPGPRAAATARELPDQPASQRDVAFLLPSGVAAGDVLESARDGGGRLLEQVELFDLYEGDDLPAGTRSVALRLRFRARGRTLTDKEVDRACLRVLRKVKEATGVEPRS